MMERLAAWLTSQPGRFAGTPAFAHALLLLAEAARTMGHIRDHVQVRWYPPGSYVVEQGEAAAELFLILSGEAEMWQEGDGGRRERLGRLGVGEFFGRARHRQAPAQPRRGRRRQPHLPGPVPGTAGQVRWPGPGSPPGRCAARRAGGRVPRGRKRAGWSGRRLLRRVRAGHAEGRSPFRLPQPVPAGAGHVPGVPAPGDVRAANTSWPCLPAGPLSWTRCPCVNQS